MPDMRVVDFTSYRELHLRIAKTTAHANGFDLEEAEKAVRKDWAEDLRVSHNVCVCVSLCVDIIMTRHTCKTIHSRELTS